MRATFNTTANPAVADVQGEANACLSALETFVENSNEVYESPSLVLHHLCLLKWCMEENERLDRETILGLEATNKKLLEAHAAMHWYSWMTLYFLAMAFILFPFASGYFFILTFGGVMGVLAGLHRRDEEAIAAKYSVSVVLDGKEKPVYVPSKVSKGGFDRSEHQSGAVNETLVAVATVSPKKKLSKIQKAERRAAREAARLKAQLVMEGPNGEYEKYDESEDCTAPLHPIT